MRANIVMMDICQKVIINLGGGFDMKNRLVGIAVLLLLVFVVFIALSGFGMLIAIAFLVMHPAVIILGTVLSSSLVLLHLMTKDKSS